MGCCQCVTEFTEEWINGTFYLKKDGNGIFSPEPPAICDWHWSYDGDTPQQEYAIDSNILIYKNIQSGPYSKCNCTNASWGRGEGVTPGTSTADVMGLITKRFKGTWISDSPNCANIGAEHRVQYAKIYQQNPEIRPYKNNHWCGDANCCLGGCDKPWPTSTRKIDKRQEFINRIRRYN